MVVCQYHHQHGNISTLITIGMCGCTLNLDGAQSDTGNSEILDRHRQGIVYNCTTAKVHSDVQFARPPV